MAIFRPSNINKRLVGFGATVGIQTQSPGNGGQIGPKKTPYDSGTFKLGRRCFFGCCSGVFKANESLCGRKEDCQCPFVDCKGLFICCGPSTAKWFVAPACTQVSRNWYSREDAVTVANSCMGSCGWFVPSCGQLQNPGSCCRIYWDSFTGDPFWSSTQASGAPTLNSGAGAAWDVSVASGAANYNPYFSKNSVKSVRAFRCTAT
jgi:hypothetical protein